MSLRSIAFYAILVLASIPGVLALIYITDFNGLAEDLGGGPTLEYIARGAPFISADASLFGQVTPAILAGALALLAPPKTQISALVISIGLCVGGWLVYLTLSMALADGSTGYQAVETYLEGASNSPDDVKVIQSFVSGSRVFFLVVAATLLGLRLRTGD